MGRVGSRKYTRMVRNYYQIYTHSVLRLLTLLRMPYEAAKRRAEPNTKIEEEGTPRSGRIRGMDYARTAGPEICRVLANAQYLFYPAILHADAM